MRTKETQYSQRTGRRPRRENSRRPKETNSSRATGYAAKPNSSSSTHDTTAPKYPIQFLIR